MVGTAATTTKQDGTANVLSVIAWTQNHVLTHLPWGTTIATTEPTFPHVTGMEGTAVTMKTPSGTPTVTAACVWTLCMEVR